MQEPQERPPTFGSGLPPKGRVADDIPRPVKELRGALRGLYKSLLGDTLDRYQAIIPSDRQFEIVKKQTMDDFGEAERVMSAIVSRTLLQGEWNGTTDADDGTS